MPRLLLPLLSCALLLSPVATAADRFHTGFFSNTAVGGFDAVAYFREGRPVAGSKKFRATHGGAHFLFKSAENLKAFTDDPDRYAPQYGGYCAWAVSQGYTAKGDPQYWRIVDDRLYLNYDDKVQQTWEANIPGFVRAADTHWPDLHDSSP